jgi:hypothetical protein
MKKHYRICSPFENDRALIAPGSESVKFLGESFAYFDFQRDDFEKNFGTIDYTGTRTELFLRPEYEWKCDFEDHVRHITITQAY